MDGTLIDSVPAVERAWRTWALEHSVPMPPSSLHGRTPRIVVENSGLPPEQFDRAERRLGEIEAEPDPGLDPLPGAMALLSALPDERWVLVTSAAGSVAAARLTSASLPAPSFRITADDVARGKPDPEPYSAGITVLRERAGSGTVIAVEDTAPGLRSARAAGCLTIGIGPRAVHPQLAPHAHMLLTSLEEIRVRLEDGSRLLMRTQTR